MNLPPAKSVLSLTPLLFAAALLLFAAGCYLPADDDSSYYGPSGYVEGTTSLVIVMQGEATQEQYDARRGEIIGYLIERGYIRSEADLVADPDQAERVIRAIANPDGGFTLSVFNRSTEVSGPAPGLWDTDLLYPADPYFILGFVYINEIGPRHLPPRPLGYRPHPHPDSYRPPSGQRVWDYARHWPNRSVPGGGSHPRPQQSDRAAGHRSPPAKHPPRDGHDNRTSLPAPAPHSAPPPASSAPEHFGRPDRPPRSQPPADSTHKPDRNHDNDQDHRGSPRARDNDPPPRSSGNAPSGHLDRPRTPQAQTPSTPPTDTAPRHTPASSVPPRPPGERSHPKPPPATRPAPPPRQEKSGNNERAQPASRNEQKEKNEK